MYSGFTVITSQIRIYNISIDFDVYILLNKKFLFQKFLPILFLFTCVTNKHVVIMNLLILVEMLQNLDLF